MACHSHCPIAVQFSESISGIWSSVMLFNGKITMTNFGTWILFNSSLNQWLKCCELHQSAVVLQQMRKTEQFRCESPHLLCGPRGRSPLASRHSRTVSLRRFYSTDLVIQLGKEPANIWLQTITAKLMRPTILLFVRFPSNRVEHNMPLSWQEQPLVLPDFLLHVFLQWQI